MQISENSTYIIKINCKTQSFSLLIKEKMSKMFWYTVFMSVLCSVSGFYFTRPDPKCDAKDMLCIKELAKKLLHASLHGDEEIGAVPLDPLHHDIIENHEADLEFSLTDSIVKGFKGMILNGVTITEENNKKIMKLDITLPNYQMTGNDKIDGKLTNVPITGEGKYFFDATNVHTVITAIKEFYYKDGNKYMKLTDFQTKTELLGAIHFNLENLFGGNKAKSEPVLKFMNGNSKVVAAYWKDIITEANIKSLLGNYNKVFQTVPLNELVIGD